MTNVHIVNHTHWDREWYFTSMDALVLSDQLFNDVITELKNNPEASFVLDGQLSILDDFIELYPEKLEEVKALIEAKQLFIGPWFTQTDAFFTSGEAILRNAMIGMFESKKYGEIMPIGYLPDTFGFNAQIPVILSEAGLENVILWRGVHLGKHVQSPYFKWESLGGESSIYALNFPQGYGSGMLLEPTLDYVEGRLDRAVDFIKQYTDSSEIMIPSGNDQLGIISDFSEKVEQINQIGKYDYKVSTYQEFLKLMEEMDLETYRGEFRAPVLARVHKTIGSVRMDLKKAIFHLEHKLIYEIEPMMVLANHLGIHLSNRLVMKAWKKLLECQAHDSLAGCVSDAVAEDIAHRLKEADEICDSIKNIILKRVAEALDLTEKEFVIVNSSPIVFEGEKVVQVLSPVKEVTVRGYSSTILNAEYIESRENILEETPAGNRYITEPGYYQLTLQVSCKLAGLGYQVFELEYENNINELLPITNTKIEMGEYSLSLEEGKLRYQDSQRIINDFISIVDQGNAGDTYDFSPVPNDSEITISFLDVHCEQSVELSKMYLTASAKLPYDLDERVSGLNSMNVEFKLTLTLSKNGEIKGNLVFNNTILNHRLRLKFNLNKSINHVISALPYGFQTKENQIIENWEKIYVEKPVNIEPFDKTVTAITENDACLVYTVDSKEYEYQEQALYITLLATTDSLGKPDLLYRPGRASGDTTKKGHIMMDTPLAQLKDKKLEYQFIVKMENETISEKEIAQWQFVQNQPSISYQKQSLNYFIYRIDNKIQKRVESLNLETKSFSMLSFDNDLGLVISSVHQSYYQSGFVIRFENPTDETIELDLEKLFEGKIIIKVNAVEQLQSMSNVIPAYGVASFLVSDK